MYDGRHEFGLSKVLIFEKKLHGVCFTKRFVWRLQYRITWRATHSTFCMTDVVFVLRPWEGGNSVWWKISGKYIPSWLSRKSQSMSSRFLVNKAACFQFHIELFNYSTLMAFFFFNLNLLSKAALSQQALLNSIMHSWYLVLWNSSMTIDVWSIYFVEVLSSSSEETKKNCFHDKKSSITI